MRGGGGWARHWYWRRELYRSKYTPPRPVPAYDGEPAGSPRQIVRRENADQATDASLRDCPGQCARPLPCLGTTRRLERAGDVWTFGVADGDAAPQRLAWKPAGGKRSWCVDTHRLGQAARGSRQLRAGITDYDGRAATCIALHSRSSQYYNGGRVEPFTSGRVGQHDVRPCPRGGYAASSVNSGPRQPRPSSSTVGPEATAATTTAAADTSGCSGSCRCGRC